MAEVNFQSDSNPWAECEATKANDSTVDPSFDDNFTPQNSGSSPAELNESGLQLPDSVHYLAVLERKLTRIQSKPSGEQQNTKECATNRSIAKEILKSLNAKRDALFQQDLPPPASDPEELNDDSTGKSLQSISSLITNTALFGALEKKISPQSQALDAEEVKKLIDADLLNLVRDLETNEATNRGDSETPKQE